MNCKPGDLAIVLSSARIPALTGCPVTVTRLDDDFPDSWQTDPKKYDPRDGAWVVFRDVDLRPLRDNDGEDETLTWAGKPSDIKTPEAA